MPLDPSQLGQERSPLARSAPRLVPRAHNAVDHDTHDTASLFGCYVLVLGSMLPGHIPADPLVGLGACLGMWACVVVLALILRAGKPPESFVHAHATWLLRSIWMPVVVGLAIVVVAFLAGLAFGGLAFVAPDVGEQAASAVAFGGVTVGFLALKLAALPLALYPLWRLLKGFVLLARGRKPANPRSWF